MSDTLLTPRLHDLGGGFVVRRLLPAAQRAAVGPFVFLDHFGPVDVAPDADHDVRPHPHIGLATLTYLFEGAMQHHDSTGALQRIEPGAVNWMSAGRGIVHSERTPAELRGRPRRSHGLQLWAALPDEAAESEPAFTHVQASQLPALEVGGARLVVAVGEAFGARSPVPARSPTLFVDVTMAAGDAFPLPPVDELAVYLVEGTAELDGRPLRPQTLQVLADPAGQPLLSASGPARLALLGGTPVGPRRLWWNFVAADRGRILRAADDWAAGRFPAVPGETDFIPLPERRPL